MHIAIVGAGFCGLATAWHLLNYFPSFPISSLVLFDSKGIGGGTSGIAAGLLHPYAGAQAKLNRMGKEGMEATCQLLAVASQSVGQPVATEQGILRLALTEKQQQDFNLSQAKYPSDTEWLESKQCQKLFPYLTQAPGLWIKRGFVVNSPLYLQGLWQACTKQKAILEEKNVNIETDLKDFDLHIIATGAEAPSLAALSSSSLTLVKGQVLELEWPPHIPPLPFALNSHVYLLMKEEQKTCLTGATFERKYSGKEPDIVKAKAEILPYTIAMLPCLTSAQVIKCSAGMRVVTPDHLPLIKQIGKQQWVITGMGSKGLLYHALMAKKLVNLIWRSLY